jgi:plasmid maintenance system antidote protein VapI
MSEHERELSLPAARRRDPLGVHRATLSDLEGGKATLSLEMALRIELNLPS